jgi:Mlc titration factor MtfA (ptsG expression regulator)
VKLVKPLFESQLEEFHKTKTASATLLQAVPLLHSALSQIETNKLQELVQRLLKEDSKLVQMHEVSHGDYFMRVFHSGI